MGCKSSSKREVPSYLGLPSETRQFPSKQSHSPSKGARKRTNETQSKQKEGNS